MAKYRKRPVVIEAEQWPYHEPAGWRGIEGVCYQNGRLEIETLEGPHTVTPGDWIITGVEGERYLCKPEIFEKTHDKVDG